MALLPTALLPTALLPMESIKQNLRTLITEFYKHFKKIDMECSLPY